MRINLKDESPDAAPVSVAINPEPGAPPLPVKRPWIGKRLWLWWVALGKDMEDPYGDVG